MQGLRACHAIVQESWKLLCYKNDHQGGKLLEFLVFREVDRSFPPSFVQSHALRPFSFLLSTLDLNSADVTSTSVILSCLRYFRL